MSIPIELTCPLGSKCEEIGNGKIKRCAWFIKVQGKNPNTGETLDEWGCSMAWLPLLAIENGNQQRSTSAAVESFRNEMVKSNQTSQKLLMATVQGARPEIKIIDVASE